ncbi:acetyl esterase/lipase [Neolewinella xylanilytica]|uniref:Acetyl esterase/lipase n=1 Tax=Neolewinella xylanilytica TaxID=1514080 RepID=A0A2S6I7A0_9BACT|nr:alpha/beta hydrolase [Neolewinella xylanilytica]PPK87382.1 acetyl esterase/lipase [Neolewinella xylanilytica]
MPKQLLFVFTVLLPVLVCSQSNPVLDRFPAGTVLHANIPYQNDTLSKHLLDIYLPADATGPLPLVIWIHGGAWLVNDKYADMSYMGGTIAEIINRGYALASIDYRNSTQAKFPAQLQDCNAAIAHLHAHATAYGLDPDRFALMGFSAGGHLASLVGLSRNSGNPDFLTATDTAFRIRAVVDFYGPAELVLFPGAADSRSPESVLIGAAPLDRPDLARAASPVTYVDAGDPPFLIVHGERDDQVDPKQSRLLSSWLTVAGVENELIIVAGAPHYGPEFDVPEVRTKVLAFLDRHLK